MRQNGASGAGVRRLDGEVRMRWGGRGLALLLAGVAVVIAGCGGDGGATDGGGVDAAVDAGALDAAGGDTGGPDAGARDTGGPDAAPPPDSAVPDAMLPDGATPDAGPGLDENFGVEETIGDPQCDGLLQTHCIMPFPSDYFLVEGEGGRRLRFGPEALPATTRGPHMDGDFLSWSDGWGPSTPILVAIPGATLEGTVPVFEPGRSLEPDAKTIILNAETGERVPHWVEWDHLARDEEPPVMVLRPAVPFARRTRYVVAIRGLVDADGAPLPPTPGFAALRDRTASEIRGVHARRARFEAEVFPVLEAHGVARDSLQLAWDFTTSSAETATATTLAVRTLLFEAIGEDGPEYTIDGIRETPDDPHIARVVTGTMRVPSFLGPPDGTRLRGLRRDEAGNPVTVGYEEVEFLLQIPHSALEGEGRAAVMQYGHGFLGRKGEARNGWMREMANRYRFLVVAIDFQGMSNADGVIWAANLARDPSVFPRLSEPPLQGLMNHVALSRLFRGRFLREADPRLTRDGEPLYDPEEYYYYGNSQGGTTGALIMAVTGDIRHGVLGVPGCAYPFLLQRSVVFMDWLRLLDRVLATRTDLSLLLGLLGTGFDRLEPLAYTDWIHDPPFEVPPRRVLLHVAKEDAQVHNQVSFVLGRALGLPLMVPAVRPVWGLPEQPYPYTGSAVVEYDFGIPDPADPMAPPPAETDTHGWLRKQPEGQEQMMHFLRTGELQNFCDGACVFDGPP